MGQSPFFSSPTPKTNQIEVPFSLFPESSLLSSEVDLESPLHSPQELHLLKPSVPWREFLPTSQNTTNHKSGLSCLPEQAKQLRSTETPFQTTSQKFAHSPHKAESRFGPALRLFLKGKGTVNIAEIGCQEHHI